MTQETALSVLPMNQFQTFSKLPRTVRITWLRFPLHSMSSWYNVRRYRHCILRYLDENWEAKEMRMDDDMSELIQHEYDHLDGILATMRAIDNKSFVIKK